MEFDHPETAEASFGIVTRTGPVLQSLIGTAEEADGQASRPEDHGPHSDEMPPDVPHHDEQDVLEFDETEDGQASGQEDHVEPEDDVFEFNEGPDDGQASGQEDHIVEQEDDLFEFEDGPDPDDGQAWSGSEEEEHEYAPYFNLLQAISEKWLLVELHHCVSKAAANAFWDIATSLFPNLYKMKENLGVRRKIPQFVHVRRKLQKKFLPRIHSTTGYQDASNEILEIPDDVPFHPKDSHKKVFETASVKVILIYQGTHFNLTCVLLTYLENSLTVRTATRVVACGVVGYRVRSPITKILIKKLSRCRSKMNTILRPEYCN